MFVIDAAGDAEVVVTGLSWRGEVCQQVFEEAAVDLGEGLKAWSDSRSGKRQGRRVGFPRFKKKTGAVASFRLRNKHPKGKPAAIRIGDNNRPRSVTLPGIGAVSVHDDTRRLRRMLAKGRAKVLFATISYHADRWWIALNVQAADLHPARLHPARPDAAGGWVGRHHHRVANVRRHFLHQVSGELVKTHDRIVIENLNVAGMLANHRLARMLRYKQAWRDGQLLEADRWYPSTRLCPECGVLDSAMTLADRVFHCLCGHRADRDTNAARNLARWGHAHHDDLHRSPDPQAGGRATNARRRAGSGQHPRVGETSPKDAGTHVHTASAA